MSNFQTLILYFFVFYVSAYFAGKYQSFMYEYSYCLCKKNKHKRLILLLCIILPIILLQGFRLNVGTDYQNYYWRVIAIEAGNLQVIKSYLSQPLFLAECYVVGKIFKDPTYFFLTDAILINLIAFKTFDYYRNKIDLKIAYMLYYSIVYMMFVNIERQAIACLIVWYAYRYIQEKNFKKYMFMVIIACTFHSSAIFFLIMFVIAKKGHNKKIVEIILFIGLILYITLSSYVLAALNRFIDGESASVYINNTHQRMHFSALLYLIMFYVPYIVMLSLPRKCGLSIFDFVHLKVDISDHLIYVCNVFTIAFVLSEAIVSYGSRLGYYTYFGLIIGVSYAYNNLRNRFDKRILYAYIIIASMVYFIRIYYIIGQAQVFPYRTIFA